MAFGVFWWFVGGFYGGFGDVGVDVVRGGGHCVVRFCRLRS